jgi:uncharacterized OB-fold protein
MKKSLVHKHYVCKKCGACYFSDKPAAEQCFDSHEETEECIW